jgi:hypothetical protein
MGNTESVIVSRHDRKHHSGTRRKRPAVSVTHEYYYPEGSQHARSSDSYVSSRRSKRRVRYPESRDSSDKHAKRPGGVRFADDYSQGGRTPKNYIIDRGYVVPRNDFNILSRAPVKQNLSGFQRLATGVAFDFAKQTQRPPHHPVPRRSQIPKAHYSSRVPLSRQDSADQPTRFRPDFPIAS